MREESQRREIWVVGEHQMYMKSLILAGTNRGKLSEDETVTRNASGSTLIILTMREEHKRQMPLPMRVL